MVEVAAGVRVHLLDPMPGAVVVRVTDGLRERGLHVELEGNSLPSRMTRLVVDDVLRSIAADATTTDVFLASRPLESADANPVDCLAYPALRSAIVGVPEAAGNHRFDPELAGRVLDRVLRELERLQAVV